MSSWSKTEKSAAGEVFDPFRFVVFLLLAALLAVSSGCSSCARKDADGERAVAPAPPSGSAARVAAHPRLRELVWRYDDAPFGPTEVVVVVPGGAREQRFPVLIALHGRGEALKSPSRGARGWLDDYEMRRALSRLKSPPLSPEDFRGLVDRARLERINRSLGRHRYGGLVVVCPYLPDILRGRSAFDQAPELARFYVERLLPRVYRETPALGEPRATGIDGVSLGGRASLLVGLLRPEAFGAVSALQPAIDSGEVEPIAALAERARRKNPALSLRLLTSREDYFLAVTRELSAALDERRLVHQLDVVTGPHDYVFNRGPGVYEMLLYHDRALRGADGSL